MTPPELIVFKGEKSQTGIAFTKRYPDIPFDNTVHNFDTIRNLIKTKPLKAVLPIWNSHAGEITDSHALSMLFNDKARLYSLWPEQIIFECLSRQATGSQEKRIISVSVAKDQCSKFIDDNDYIFREADSTIDAYKKFKEDCDYVAVLCAPGTNEESFELLSANAANPINFTTFALLGSYHSISWVEAEWEPFSCEFSRVFTALQMPFSLTLSDSQEELLDRLIGDAECIDDVPSVLFVTRHEGGNCRIILESSDEFAPSEILDEEGVNEEINIIPDVGRTSEKYSERINPFLKDYIELSSNDFVKHQGTRTCFYACPVLGIVTHGFESDVTEFIVRQIIKRHFELIERGADASEEQKTFYDKYVKDYQESGIDFIKFENIGLDTTS